jgi:hypothetical protein
MYDELDPTIVDEADLQKMAIGCCTDEHREVIEIEDTGRVAVGVQDVIVKDPVLACTS